MKKKKFKKQMQFYVDTEILKWITINNEKTRYMISNKGYVMTTDYYGKTGKFAILKSRVSSNGYHNLTLQHKGKIYPVAMHRLVAIYFVPNPDNLGYVNHIDGDKANNISSNLEWVTAKENSIHAVTLGLTPTGEACYLSKITESTAIKICEDISSNKHSISDIANRLGTTYDIVYDIYRGKTWKKISKKYDFSNFNRDNRYKNKERSTTIESIEKSSK